MKILLKYCVNKYLRYQNRIFIKLPIISKLIFITGFFLCLSIFPSCSRKEKIPIRIGYSSLTPIHCHVGEVFSRTGILDRYRLDAKLISFKRGYEQGWAMEKGGIDVAFSCEVPAILLLQSNPNMRIVASPGVLGRIAILVTEGSDIYKVRDLQGKKVAVSKGSTAHKDLVRWMQEAGLNPVEDIHMFDVPPEKIEKLVADKLVDAIVTWDPWVETMKRNNNLRVVKERLFWSVILVSQGYIDRYPEGVRRFLRAVKEAIYWSVAHKDTVNRWVAEKSNWELDVVETVTDYNKNFSHTERVGDVNLCLGRETIQILKGCDTFLKELKIVPESFDLNTYLTQGSFDCVKTD